MCMGAAAPNENKAVFLAPAKVQRSRKCNLPSMPPSTGLSRTQHLNMVIVLLIKPIVSLISLILIFKNKYVSLMFCNNVMYLE